MKTRIILGAVLLATSIGLLAQSEQVKSKAKDLKRKIESQQTNTVGDATNSPARPK
jgi:hypothetical protein